MLSYKKQLGAGNIFYSVHFLSGKKRELKGQTLIRKSTLAFLRSFVCPQGEKKRTSKYWHEKYLNVIKEIPKHISGIVEMNFTFPLLLNNSP